ncbi:MAG TPA: hypothetical protein VMB48_14245 [Steroidobacteraceae bacterium]|nr:hypothetical protein [Steroidobacteraceae bacterium]
MSAAAYGRRRAPPGSRRWSWALLLLLVLLPGRLPHAAGAAAAAQLAAANQALQAGRYAAAIAGYNGILRERGFSANILYDLGNAWLLAGQPGEAILNYERAAWLAPRDPAIRANLAVARVRARITAPARGTWEQAARAVRLDTVAVCALAGLALLCAGIYLRHAAHRRLGPWMIVPGALLLCAAAGAMALRWSDLNQAIILRDVPARIAPAPSAAASFALRAGQSVQVDASYGGYVRIHDGAGAGWVEAAALQRVLVAGAASLALPP